MNRSPIERGWQMNVWRSIKFISCDFRINLIVPFVIPSHAEVSRASPIAFGINTKRWQEKKTRAQENRDYIGDEKIAVHIVAWILPDEWDIARKWSRSDLNLHSTKWYLPYKCKMQTTNAKASKQFSHNKFSTVHHTLVLSLSLAVCSDRIRFIIIIFYYSFDRMETLRWKQFQLFGTHLLCVRVRSRTHTSS